MGDSVGAGGESLEGEAKQIFAIVVCDLHDFCASRLMDSFDKNAAELFQWKVFCDTK